MSIFWSDRDFNEIIDQEDLNIITLNKEKSTQEETKSEISLKKEILKMINLFEIQIKIGSKVNIIKLGV